MKAFIPLTVILVIGICLPGVRSTQSAPVSELPEVVVNTLKAPNLRILANADRVEAFRVKPEPLNSSALQQKFNTPQKEIGGFPIIGLGKEQSTEFAHKLYETLSNVENCKHQMLSDCMFSPGVAFRVWSGMESVDVLLCFHCNEAYLDRKDANGTTAEKTDVGIRMIRSELLRLSQQAFPKDKDLKALK